MIHMIHTLCICVIYTYKLCLYTYISVIENYWKIKTSQVILHILILKYNPSPELHKYYPESIRPSFYLFLESVLYS